MHGDSPQAVVRPHVVIPRDDRTGTRRERQFEQNVVLGIGRDQITQRRRYDGGRARLDRHEDPARYAAEQQPDIITTFASSTCLTVAHASW
jgi:hypothetical protein